MAVEYNADFTGKGWEQPLNADSFQLDAEYTAGIKGKATMIFDVYFPDSVGDIGTIKAQAVLHEMENSGTGRRQATHQLIPHRTW